jgi:hypothetical protein
VTLARRGEHDGILQQGAENDGGRSDVHVGATESTFGITHKTRGDVSST